MFDLVKQGLAAFARSILTVLRVLGHWAAAPFRAFARWAMARGIWVQVVLAILILPWLIGYGHFMFNALVLRGFDVDWADSLGMERRVLGPGKATVTPPTPVAPAGVAARPPVATPAAAAPAVAAGGAVVATPPRPPVAAAAANAAATPAALAAAAAAAAAAQPTVCGRSYIVDASAALIEFNVRKNLWMSSNPFYKMGFFFLIDWERTKFLDNKAAFQRGVHQAVARTAADLADLLGRVRGTSQVDPDLQIARGNLQFDQFTWAFNPFSDRPFGPTTRSPTFYIGAENALRRYQARLITCNASFDERADNLLQFLDHIAADIGSTSATLMERTETHHSGWFDTRADDMFQFAKGQMYAYAGILEAARADFADVVAARELSGIWDNMTSHFRHATELRPRVISNGPADSLFMPSHLTAMGFYILRARANLVELRSVLDR